MAGSLVLTKSSKQAGDLILRFTAIIMSSLMIEYFQSWKFIYYNILHSNI